jgi:hypothetical protein
MGFAPLSLLVSLTPPWWMVAIFAAIAFSLVYGVTALVAGRD